MANIQKIIWIFGISASGKGTFLKKLKNQELDLKKFGISNKLKICESSLKCGKTETRDHREMEKEIKEIIRKGMPVIIKFQFDDVNDNVNIPQKIRNIFPSLEHEVWMLVIKYEEMERRWNERLINNSEWKDKPNEKNYKDGTERVKKIVDGIDSGFIKKYFFSDNYDYIPTNSDEVNAIFDEKKL